MFGLRIAAKNACIPAAVTGVKVMSFSAEGLDLVGGLATRAGGTGGSTAGVGSAGRGSTAGVGSAGRGSTAGGGSAGRGSTAGVGWAGGSESETSTAMG